MTNTSTKTELSDQTQATPRTVPANAKEPQFPAASVQEPKANPAAKWIGLLFSLFLIAVAVIAGRELFILFSDTDQQSWVEPALSYVGNLEYQSWMFPAGIAAVIVGLILVFIALKPRKKTHHRLIANVPVYLRTIDVVRMCTAAAEKVAGVHDASTDVSKRSVTVTIHGTDPDGSLSSRVAQAVQPLVERIDGSPTLKVKMESER